MDPKVWGRNMWTTMLNVAKVYPDNPNQQEKNNYKIYYTIIKDILPCYTCRINYAKHLEALPIQLNNRRNLLSWLHQIHNKTLHDMNRKELIYNEFINKYDTTMSSSDISLSPKMIMLMILVIIAGGYYYYVGNRRSVPFFPR